METTYVMASEIRVGDVLLNDHGDVLGKVSRAHAHYGAMCLHGPNGEAVRLPMGQLVRVQREGK